MTVPVGKLHWFNLWAMGIEKNIVGRKYVDTLEIVLEKKEERMSGELFNEIDDTSADSLF